MTKIGRAKIRYKGEFVQCDVFDDGTIELDNGKRIKLPDDKFQAIKKQLTAVSVKSQNQQPLDDLKQVEPFEKYDLSAEHKLRRKKRIKIVLGILFAAVLLVVAFLLIRWRFPEIIGFAPNSYRVAVANTDIAAGDTIESSEISYIELSREEYSAQCVETYMAENGSLKRDEPIFYINANNAIVGKFAAEDIAAGDIIKDSMVTSTRYEGQIEVNGESQNVQMTESQLNGQTDIQIIARITNEDGEVQEIVLSSMKLQGKSLTELLDGAGQNVLVEDNSNG